VWELRASGPDRGWTIDAANPAGGRSKVRRLDAKPVRPAELAYLSIAAHGLGLAEN